MLFFYVLEKKKNIESEFEELAELCLPIHQEIITRLIPKAILCLGKRAGGFVRKELKADELVSDFVESNDRKWTSQLFKSASGLSVIVAAHPSRVDWKNSTADLSCLVIQALQNHVQ